ncbi:MAG TPA: hypothetical protein VFV95_03285 [Vicinamibacterales bacterium]|nr:hypothetical protein [Vicinamibacterales bacterium]
MRRTLFSARLRYQLLALGGVAAVSGLVASLVQGTYAAAVVCAAALAVFVNALRQIRCSRCDRRLLFYEGRFGLRLPARCRVCGRSTRRSWSADMPDRSAPVPAYDLGRRRNY